MNNNMNNNTDEQIAIIGWSGRFPKASDVDIFWRNLLDVQDCTQKIPAGPNQDPAFVNRISKLQGIEYLDAEFFGYSPREATNIDPQQRLFLEHAWLALENAGYEPGGKESINTGVFGGSSISTYLMSQLSQHPDFTLMDPIDVLMCNDKDFLATRVAHKLGLHGPSFSVQTACSTSLVAVHLACQSLLNGECDMALAGGSTVLLPEDTGYLYTEGGIRSPDGYCRPFDDQGDGTIFGSGCALVVLKPLQDALDEHCTIHAVIKGSAINNDGNRKVSFSAPSVTGQRDVIVEAMEIAGLHSDDIGAIECHGTATRLGDPIEVSALQQAFEINKDPERPERSELCRLGSVKGNIGHLDAAAGITGLIKAALMVRERKLPGTAHFKKPNQELQLHETPFTVSSDTSDWPESLPPNMGISSFGVGGTNAHLIIGPAPEQNKQTSTVEHKSESVLLLLSARSDDALVRAQNALAEYLAHNGSDGSLDLNDIAYTLQVGRKDFQKRSYVVAENIEQTCGDLKALATVISDIAFQPGTTRTAFAFPGQGTHELGAAKPFYMSLPDFAVQMDSCLESMDPKDAEICRSCLLEKTDEAQRWLKQTQYAQPCLFILGYALSKTIENRGIEADCALGHSIGEYLAATWAGVFSLTDALKLVIARGRAMQSAPEGAMIVVVETSKTLKQLMTGFELEVAVRNMPNSSVIAGAPDEIDRFTALLTDKQMQYRRLDVSHAFHSKSMEVAASVFRETMQGVRLRPMRKPFLSNVTGTWITDSEAMDPEYWVKHLRAQVRFSDDLNTLAADMPVHLIELGAGHSISYFSSAAEGAYSINAIPVLGKSSMDILDGQRIVLQAAGKYWAAGGDLKGVHQKQARRIPLPGYSFERQRYWITSAPNPINVGSISEQSVMQNQTDSSTVESIPISEKMMRGWKHVLGFQDIAEDANFFVLGGTSIQVLELIRYLKRSGLALTPQEIFRHPTPEAMITLLKSKEISIQQKPSAESHIEAVQDNTIVQSVLSVLENDRQ